MLFAKRERKVTFVVTLVAKDQCGAIDLLFVHTFAHGYKADLFLSFVGVSVGTPGGISSKDVQPTVQMPAYPTQPAQFQAPPGLVQPLIYDSGLIQAVTNAQNFVAQTFPGARLLESHNVSL